MTVILERIVVRGGWLQNNHVNVPKSIVEVCLGSSPNGRVNIHFGRVPVGSGALQQSTGHLTGVADLLNVIRIQNDDIDRRELRVWVDDAEKDSLHFEEAPQTARAEEWGNVEQARDPGTEELFFFDANRGVFAHQPPSGKTEWHRTPYRPPYLSRLHANPSLSPQMSDEIRLELLSREHQGGPSRSEIDNLESEEGRLVLLVHQRRERARGLVQAKLRSVQHHDCEVCGFSFQQQYGTAGSGFAEVHHRTPLASSRRIVRTTLEDLAIVCANCHRMLHRKPWPSIPELQGLLLDDGKILK